MNVVNKGKVGEREVCDLLRIEAMRCFTENQWIDKETRDRIFASIQRNQNQSAVGGHDIEFMGLSIEVKRQEALSLVSWWQQTMRAAEKINARPVLIYRQNHKPWRVKMEVQLHITPEQFLWAPAEIEVDIFERWLRSYIAMQVRAGRVP